MRSTRVRHPKKVGTYPALTGSGGGRRYDEVLEYRVWKHERGGDGYHAFASARDAERRARERGSDANLIRRVTVDRDGGIIENTVIWRRRR
jgi:hypothetical protein